MFIWARDWWKTLENLLRSCASHGGGGGRPASHQHLPSTYPATIALYMHVCLTALVLKISR